jgi:hypothetical protein
MEKTYESGKKHMEKAYDCIKHMSKKTYDCVKHMSEKTYSTFGRARSDYISDARALRARRSRRCIPI